MPLEDQRREMGLQGQEHSIPQHDGQLLQQRHHIVQNQEPLRLQSLGQGHVEERHDKSNKLVSPKLLAIKILNSHT